MGMTFVIVNDLDTAIDMLDKKGNIYVDRIQTTMLQISGWCRGLGLMPYSPKYRELRKVRICALTYS